MLHWDWARQLLPGGTMMFWSCVISTLRWGVAELPFDSYGIVMRQCGEYCECTMISVVLLLTIVNVAALDDWFYILHEYCCPTHPSRMAGLCRAPSYCMVQIVTARIRLVVVNGSCQLSCAQAWHQPPPLWPVAGQHQEACLRLGECPGQAPAGRRTVRVSRPVGLAADSLHRLASSLGFIPGSGLLL
jgi:hypothetical protein